MGKYKIEHKSGQNFLVIQGQKGQQISEREYYAISTGQIPGLLRAELVRKGKSFKLIYNISGYISLRDYLVNPMNKQTFVKLLTNILNNLKALEQAYYNHQFILMDMNTAMVNPATQQVIFVYVPVIAYDSGTSLRSFLLSIIQCCSFAHGESTEYVRDYIKILNRGINFSVFDLEEYIKNLNTDDNSQAKKCPRCNTPILQNVNFCSSCGMKLSGIPIENSHGIYDPAKVLAKPQRREPVSSNAPEPIKPDTVAHSIPVDQHTAMPPQKNQQVYITRQKNGQQIPISADSFRIGKDPFNCEYCVSDNPAISRCHAVIVFKNGKWYINDLNSTNKTYLNDRAIPPYTDMELCDGMQVKLANESYIFNLFN